jgi:hypothetical protein
MPQVSRRGSFHCFSWLFLLGYLIRIIVFLLLAGSVSALVTQKQATRTTCFLTGLSVVFLLTTLLTANANRFDKVTSSSA